MSTIVFTDSHHMFHIIDDRELATFNINFDEDVREFIRSQLLSNILKKVPRWYRHDLSVVFAHHLVSGRVLVYNSSYIYMGSSLTIPWYSCSEMVTHEIRRQ